MLAGTNVFAGGGRTPGDSDTTKQPDVVYAKGRDGVYLASDGDAPSISEDTTGNTEEPQTEKPSNDNNNEPSTGNSGDNGNNANSGNSGNNGNSGNADNNGNSGNAASDNKSTGVGNVEYVRKVLSVPSKTYTQAEIAALKKKYENTKAEKQKVHNDINSLKETQNDFITVLKEMDKMIIEYEDKKFELEQKKKNAEATIEEIQTELEAAMAEEQAQYDVLKDHIKNAYENQNYTYLDALLNAVDFADVVNNSEYIQAVSDYDKKLLDDFIEKRRSIANKKKMLEIMVEDSGTLQEAYQDEEDILLELTAAKEEQIKNYQEAINRGSNEFKTIAEKEAQLDKELKGYITNSHSQLVYSDVKYNGELFAWPIPASTYISSYFGLRDAPTEGASTNHAGLDFGADVGDDIVSSMDGVVIKIDYNEFRGNFIVVDVGTDKSGRSITVLYQHLSGVACNLGDKVVRGQVIGYAGETGVATGPHLHYEVRVDGDPVDPLPYLGLN